MIIGFGAFRLTDIGMGGLPDLQWWTNAGGERKGGAPHGPEHVKECTSALYYPLLQTTQNTWRAEILTGALIGA